LLSAGGSGVVELQFCRLRANWRKALWSWRQRIDSAAGATRQNIGVFPDGRHSRTESPKSGDRCGLAATLRAGEMICSTPGSDENILFIRLILMSAIQISVPECTRIDTATAHFV